MVTYKYLSRALDVHVNTAKQMLWNYKESKQGACKGVVYFVSGLVSNKTILLDLHTTFLLRSKGVRGR